MRKSVLVTSHSGDHVQDVLRNAAAKDRAIRLVLEGRVELFQNVLLLPHVDRIVALDWEYRGFEEPPDWLAERLLTSCPKLEALEIKFRNCSAFDFVAQMLEQSSLIKRLAVHPPLREPPVQEPSSQSFWNFFTWMLTEPVHEPVVPPVRGVPRFFDALERSCVVDLEIGVDVSSEFLERLHSYLEGERLGALELHTGQGPTCARLLQTLAGGTRLTKLAINGCTHSLSLRIPKSVVDLTLRNCSVFVGVTVAELAQSLGQLDSLTIHDCQFSDALLLAMELRGLSSLDVRGDLDMPAVLRVAGAVRKGRMKSLSLPYNSDTASRFRTVTHLGNLSKLRFRTESRAERKVIRVLARKFAARVRMYALLQGQQIWRLRSPLRRLPVEMMRLVGQMLPQK